jgi:hypothetical protein
MHGTWLVLYPSRRVMRFEGELGIQPLPDDTHVPAVYADTGEVYLLDPRAIIRRHPSGEVCYTPSSIPVPRLSGWAREWIAEHPEWESEWVA